MRLLEQRGADVVYHDPHVPTFREDGHVREGVPLTPDELRAADAVVIVTDHGALDIQLVVDNATVVVDTRNATARAARAGRARVIGLASGTAALPGVDVAPYPAPAAAPRPAGAR
jgi:UDP-N-acetyl-D-glucosamine dehydrogenase